jgi:HD-like signal output (HDOD) protein
MTPEELVSDVDNLFSLPELYLKVRDTISDPRSSIDDVANIVSQDPSISARLIRISNSSFFGFAAEIETVMRAISIMGLSQLHDLVLATSVVKSFKGIPNDLINMKEFWARSVYCGIISRLIARKCNVLDSERLFLTGLLHDIGHLIIYTKLARPAFEILSEAKLDNKPVQKLERDIFGFDYAQVGGALLKSWKLPKSHIETVEFHTNLAKADEFALDSAIVHLASTLVLQEESKKNGITAPDFDTKAWDVTELMEEDLDSIKLEAKQSMLEVLRLLFTKA